MVTACSFEKNFVTNQNDIQNTEKFIKVFWYKMKEDNINTQILIIYTYISVMVE